MRPLDRVQVSPAHRHCSGERGTVWSVDGVLVTVALDRGGLPVFARNELTRPEHYAALKAALERPR
jgi:hypothetical protein